MNRNLKFIPVLFCLLFIIWGCSTEKNTWFRRAYHNTTAHYNIYFNGEQSLKTGVDKIDEMPDDFNKMLPVFKESMAGSEAVCKTYMDTALLKAFKLIRDHSITKRPKNHRRKKRQKIRTDYNNWIDDSYILIGQAKFYQKKYSEATGTFSYVMRRFSSKDIRAQACIWLIRCYTETRLYNEAFNLITVTDINKIPGRFRFLMNETVADFYLKQGKYEDAVTPLMMAISRAGTRNNKARLKYLLAQVYKETGQDDLAFHEFNEAARTTSSYRMSLNAKINALMSLPSDDKVTAAIEKLKYLLEETDKQELKANNEKAEKLSQALNAGNNRGLRSREERMRGTGNQVAGSLSVTDNERRDISARGQDSLLHVSEDSTMTVINEDLSDYFSGQEARDTLENLYEQAYNAYQKEDYETTLILAHQIVNMGTDSLMMQRFFFIAAIAEGKQTNRERMKELMEEYVERFPYAPLVPLAENIIKLIGNNAFSDYKDMLASGYIREKQPDSEKTEDKPSLNMAAIDSSASPATEIAQEEAIIENLSRLETKPVTPPGPAMMGPFLLSTEGEHYFVLIIPGDIDKNPVLNAINIFVNQNYPERKLAVKDILFGKDQELLRVGAFKDRDEGMNFIRQIIQDQSVYSPLGEAEYRNFIISARNYPVFMENRDITAYLNLYKKVYLKTAGKN